MENLYIQGKDKVSNFDIIFSYDNKEIKKILEKLGVNSKEVVSIGMNGFVRKSDVGAFNEMDDSFKYENMKNDEYAYELFKYEMGNHEYIITCDDEILRTCEIDEHLFIADERLKEIYINAKNVYLKEINE